MSDDDERGPAAEGKTTDDEKNVGKDPSGQRQAGAKEPEAPVNPSPNQPSKALVALVYSSEVQKLIKERVARGGIPEAEREEVLQDVCAGLLYMANAPEDLESCLKAAHDNTEKRIADRLRKKYRRQKYGDVGPTAEADQHIDGEAREQANGVHAQQLALLREATEDGSLDGRDAEIMLLKRDGHTDAQIAKKFNVAPQTVSNRVALIRKTMRARWKTRAAALAALAFAVLMVVCWKKKDDIEAFLFGHPTVTPAPSGEPMKPEPEPSIPVAVQGEKLRKEASEMCRQARFHECSDLLEKAAKIDPVGDLSPEALALRHLIEDAIRDRQFNAKPGVP